MKISFFGDIHDNIRALEAVLRPWPYGRAPGSMIMVFFQFDDDC